jgi:hypothetical protein
MKCELAALAMAISSASAFVAPSAFSGAQLSTRVASKSTMSMAYPEDWASVEGAQAPLGFFDPLGLLNGADQDRFERLRYVEVKHGRISMLAVLGHLVQQNQRLPGYLSTSQDIKFADVPNGLAAFTKIPVVGTLQLFLFIGALEVFVMKQAEGSTPGDMNLFGFGPNSQWAKWDEETRSKKRSIELNNGRAAQMGILALMVHEKLNNHPYIINDILGKAYTFP